MNPYEAPDVKILKIIPYILDCELNIYKINQNNQEEILYYHSDQRHNHVINLVYFCNVV